MRWMNGRMNVSRIYHRVVIAVAFLLVLALVYLQVRGQDVYSYHTTDEGYRYDDLYTLDGDKVLIEGCERCYLYPGNYRLIIHTLDVDGTVYFQVYDKWGNHVLAEQEYEADVDDQMITFTTDVIYEDVVVRTVTPVAVDETQLQITGYDLESSGLVGTDRIWSIVLLVLLMGLLYVGYWRWRHNGRLTSLILTIAAVLMSLPFYSANLQYGHNIRFHLTRIANIGRAISGGYYPERINSLTRGGTIIPIMYPEALLTGAGFMVSTGATVFLAYKVLCTCMTLAVVYVAYYAARQIVDERPAMMFAILWLINPFRLNELFVRAALGEALANIFLPLIAVGMWQVFYGSGRRGVVDLLLGYSGLLATHMLSAVIVAVFCALFVALRFAIHPMRFLRDIRRLGYLAVAALLTVLLNMYYLVPFLTFYGWDLWLSTGEQSYLIVEDSVAPLWQLFMGAVGYGSNDDTTNLQGEMPISIGSALLLASVVWIVYSLYKEREVERLERSCSDVDRAVWYSLLISGCAVFMTSVHFPWGYLFSWFDLVVRTLGRVQYVWRLMMIPACLLSFLMGVLVMRMIDDHSTLFRMIAMGLCVIAVIGAIDTATFYYSQNRTLMADHYDAVIDDNLDYISTHAYSEHRDELRKWLIDEACGPILLDGNKNVTISDYHRTGVSYEFIVSNTGTEDAVVTVPVFCYGLHRAVMNDANGEVELSMVANAEYQLSDVTIPAGTTEGKVRLVYTEPISFGLGYVVSGMTLLTLIVGGYMTSRRNHKRMPMSILVN